MDQLGVLMGRSSLARMRQIEFRRIRARARANTAATSWLRVARRVCERRAANVARRWFGTTLGTAAMALSVGCLLAPGYAAAAPMADHGHTPTNIPDLANPTASAGAAFLSHLFPVNSADWQAGMQIAAFDEAIVNGQLDPCLRAKGFPPPSGPQGVGGTNNLTFPDIEKLATVGFYGPTTTKTTRPPTTNTTSSYKQAYEAAQEACSAAVKDPLRKLIIEFTSAGSLGTQWLGIIQRINHLPRVTKALSLWRHCMGASGDAVSTPTAFFGQVTGYMRSLTHAEALRQEKHLAMIYAKCFGPVESLRVRLRTQQRNKFFAEHAEAIDAAMRRVTAMVARLSSKFHTPFEVKRAS